QYQNLISILNLIDPIYYNKFDNEVFQCAYHFTHDKAFRPDILVNILNELKKIKEKTGRLISTDGDKEYQDQVKELIAYVRQLTDGMMPDDMQYIKVFLEIIKLKKFESYDFKTRTLDKIIYLKKTYGLSNVDDLCNIIELLNCSEDPYKVIYENCFHIIQDQYGLNPVSGEIFQYIDLFPRLKSLTVHSIVFGFPDAITRLTDLETLSFSSHSDFFVPDSIDNLKNLKELKIGSQKFVTLPESIGSLENLEILDLSGCQLTSLPESIVNLKNLKELNLSGCQLTSLPESIGNLKSLKKLDLSQCRLTSLPESIGNLESLKELDLSQCRLTSLPESIGNLESLKDLDLSESQLTFLPESIGNLKKLNVLDLSECQLTFLPESIGNLKSLNVLDLEHCQLTSLPESIGNLKRLNILNLNHCQLTIFPDSIGNLMNLFHLFLDGNNLTTIPASIKNLRILTLFNLRNNPYLLPRSDNPLQWGKEELRAHFGDRLEFDEPSLEPMPIQTNKMGVYSALDKQSLRINRNIFVSNKLPEINVDKVFNGHEMLDVLEQIMVDLNFYDETKPGYLSYEMLASDFASDAKNQNLSNLEKVFQYLAPRLTGYIRALYKLPLIGNDVKPWKMYEAQIPETQKALTFIMDRINHTIDPDAKMLLFNLLVNGLLHCPTGQAEGINAVAYAISENGYQTNNFKDNLKHFLAVKKNAHFTTAILAKAAENSQNVHLISSYRDQLKDELGLNAAIASYQERMGATGQDPFAGNKWNVVEVFYGLVSPDRLIDWVMQSSETNQDAQDLREELGIGGKDLSPADREKEILRLRTKTRQNRQFRPFTTGSIVEYLYLQGLISDDENDTKWQKYFTADPLDTDGAPAVLTRDGEKAILIHEGFLIDDSLKDEMIVDHNAEKSDSIDDNIPDENNSNNFINWNSIDD
ncbi:MAG: leucine-rich repeat domain-containing protein, partial [Alphaproteobacteria bacterium]|nr:leucine-rich repeat domain-containing protein [Alphaproteobacteria bacterium]